MNIIITLCVLLFTTLVGFSVIERLKTAQVNSVVLKIAAGFGVGFGIVAAQMFLYSILSIEWSRWSLAIPYLVSIPLLIKKIKPSRIRFRFVKKSKVNYFLVTLILLLAAFTFFESTLRPLSSWDGWSSWQMRSKAYFLEKQVNTQSFHYLQTDYPLAVPLYSTFLYVALGQVDDTAVQLVSWSFYVMIGLTAYAFIKREVGTRPALWTTFLLLSTQNLIRHGGRFEAGMADIVFGYFVFSSLIFTYYYLAKKTFSNAIMVVLLITITSQIKNEGIAFSFLIMLIMAFVTIRDKKYRHFALLIFYLIFLLGWQAYKYVLNLSVGISDMYLRLDLLVLLKIIREEVLQLVNVQNWNLGWLYFLTTIFLMSRKYVVFYLAIFAQMFLYVIIFLISSMVPWEHARGISDRLFLHLYPSAVVVSMLTTFILLKKHKIFGKLIYD